jgi:hypothetical protein
MECIILNWHYLFVERMNITSLTPDANKYISACVLPADYVTVGMFYIKAVIWNCK